MRNNTLTILNEQTNYSQFAEKKENFSCSFLDIWFFYHLPDKLKKFVIKRVIKNRNISILISMLEIFASAIRLCFYVVRKYRVNLACNIILVLFSSLGLYSSIKFNFYGVIIYNGVQGIILLILMILILLSMSLSKTNNKGEIILTYLPILADVIFFYSYVLLQLLAAKMDK